MIGLLPILARWKVGIGLFAALALAGAFLAAKHYRHAYYAEKALRADDKANYTAAQNEAYRLAKEEHDRAERLSKEKADATDQRNALAADAARASTHRYAIDNRVRVSPDEGNTSVTIASTKGNSAQGTDRSSPAPDMVAVTEADLQVCTTNTLRLEAARDWALHIND